MLPIEYKQTMFFSPFFLSFSDVLYALVDLYTVRTTCKLAKQLKLNMKHVFKEYLKIKKRQSNEY